MSPEAVKVEHSGPVQLITLNAPERGNAYTDLMGQELSAALVAGDADPDVRVMVVTGAGKHFCVGVDLSGDADNRLAWIRRGETDKVLEEAQHEKLRPWELTTPIIGALNGAAVGVGLTLPLQWDLRIVAEDAKYGMPFVQRGVIPELNSTWLLTRMIGAANALELMLTGRLFLGSEAKQLGLAHEAVPSGAVLDRAMEIAENIATNAAPAAVAAVKSLINIGLAELDRYTAWARELEVFATLAKEPDAAEGAQAFIDKRAPTWTGDKGFQVPLTPTTTLPAGQS